MTAWTALAVSGYYSAYLHRAADAGAEVWIAALRNGPAALGQVAVGILSDPGNEFFTNGHGGVTSVVTASCERKGPAAARARSSSKSRPASR